MGTNTTGTSVSSGEMEVKTVKNSDVEAEKMKNGYGSAVFTAVEMAPLLDNYKESSDPNASGDSGNNSTKKSDYLIIGNTMIMRFREKIQDIINGVALKFKGPKTKGEKETKKKVEDKETLEQPSKEDGPENR